VQKKKSAEIGKLFRLEFVSLVIKDRRQWWFGHVECKDSADWWNSNQVLES